MFARAQSTETVELRLEVAAWCIVMQYDLVGKQVNGW